MVRKIVRQIKSWTDIELDRQSNKGRSYKDNEIDSELRQIVIDQYNYRQSYRQTATDERATDRQS